MRFPVMVIYHYSFWYLDMRKKRAGGSWLFNLSSLSASAIQVNGDVSKTLWLIGGRSYLLLRFVNGIVQISEIEIHGE